MEYSEKDANLPLLLEAVKTESVGRTRTHNQALASVLSQHATFRTFPELKRIQLTKRMEYLSMRTGELVCRQWDSDSQFLVLLSGKAVLHVRETVEEHVLAKTFNIAIDDRSQQSSSAVLPFDGIYGVEVATLLPGDTFGDIAITRGQLQGATMRCHGICEFAVLRRPEYEIVENSMKAEYKRAMLEEEKWWRPLLETPASERSPEVVSKIAYFLNHSVLGIFFNQLPLPITEMLARQMGVQTYKKNDVILQEGEIATKSCFLYSGAVEILEKGQLLRRRSSATGTSSEKPSAKTSERRRISVGTCIGHNSVMARTASNFTAAAANDHVIVVTIVDHYVRAILGPLHRKLYYDPFSALAHLQITRSKRNASDFQALVQILRRRGNFKLYPRAQLHLIFSSMETNTIPAGSSIWLPDDVDEGCMYVLLSGRIKVVQDATQNKQNTKVHTRSASVATVPIEARASFMQKLSKRGSRRDVGVLSSTPKEPPSKNNAAALSRWKKSRRRTSIIRCAATGGAFAGIQPTALAEQPNGVTKVPRRRKRQPRAYVSTVSQLVDDSDLVKAYSAGDCFGVSQSSLAKDCCGTRAIAEVQCKLSLMTTSMYNANMKQFEDAKTVTSVINALKTSPENRDEDQVASVVDLLKTLPLYHQLDSMQLEKLSMNVAYVKCSRTEMLYRQGEEANAFYLILSGNVALYRRTDDRKQGNSNQDTQKLAESVDDSSVMIKPLIPESMSNATNRRSVLSVSRVQQSHRQPNAMVSSISVVAKALKMHNVHALHGTKEQQLVEKYGECQVVLHPTNTFGENALIDCGCVTQATAIAIQDTELMILTRFQYKRVQTPAVVGTSECLNYRPEILGLRVESRVAKERWNLVRNVVVNNKNRVSWWPSIINNAHEQRLRSTVEQVQDAPVFRDMEERLLQKICSRATIIELKADTRIFAKGDIVDKFFMILDGSVDIYVSHGFDAAVSTNHSGAANPHSNASGGNSANWIHVASLYSGQTFGHFELLASGQFRLLSARTSSKARLVSIYRGFFQTNWPEASDMMSVYNFIKQHPIFQGLEADRIAAFYYASRIETYRCEEVVTFSNSAEDKFYIIKTGEFNIVEKVAMKQAARSKRRSSVDILALDDPAEKQDRGIEIAANIATIGARQVFVRAPRENPDKIVASTPQAVVISMSLETRILTKRTVQLIHDCASARAEWHEHQQEALSELLSSTTERQPEPAERRGSMNRRRSSVRRPSARCVPVGLNGPRKVRLASFVNQRGLDLPVKEVDESKELEELMTSQVSGPSSSPSKSRVWDTEYLSNYKKNSAVSGSFMLVNNATANPKKNSQKIKRPSENTLAKLNDDNKDDHIDYSALISKQTLEDEVTVEKLSKSLQQLQSQRKQSVNVLSRGVPRRPKRIVF